MGRRERSARMRTICVGCGFFTGGLSLLLGVVFLIVLPAIWFPVIKPFGEQQLKEAILDNAITTSNSSSGFAMWQSNNSPESPPFILAATFFNLTNPQEVLQGQKPNFVETQPYYYYYNRTKINLEWIADEEGHNEAVRYWEYRRMSFIPEMNEGRSEDDIIFNVNPAFVGALNSPEVNGDFMVVQTALAGPGFQQVFDNYLTSLFVKHIMIENIAELLLTQVTNSTSLQSWLAIWANATAPPSSQYYGYIISENNTPSGLSLATAEYLFNAAEDYSLLNINFDMQVTWFNATQLPVGDPNQQAAQQTISAATSLNGTEFQLIANWINSVNFTNNLQEFVQNKFMVSELSDLGYMQWLHANVTINGSAISELYPWDVYWALSDPSNPCVQLEFPIYLGKTAKSYSSLTLEDAKNLFQNPEVGFFTTNAFNLLNQYNNYGDYGGIEQTWNVDQDVAFDMVNYFLFSEYCQETTVGMALGNSFFISEILPNYGDYGGLFIARGVSDILFNATDPLLVYLQPENPKAALLRNDSSEVDSLSYAPSTYYTGYNDTNLVNYIIEWEGNTQIEGVYAISLPINGTNDWGQFPPFLNTSTVLTSFSEDYYRTFTLVYNNTIYDYYDIEMYRYLVDQSSFAVNYDLYQYFVGFANLAGAHNNTPIFLSNPHFAGADANWTEAITGIVPNPLNDTTVIDIEPTSGAVSHVFQASQVNIQIVDSLGLDTLPYFDFSNLTLNLMYPLVWIAEEATLNQENADQIKQIYLARDIFNNGIYVSLAIGLVLVLIGSIVLVITTKKQNALTSNLLDGDYEQINDD